MFWRRREEPADWLVVGLGNPGDEYHDTPHNLGFLVVDRLAHDESIRVTRPEENALVGRGTICGRKAVLAKPLTYMNLSGGPVKGLMRRYGQRPASLLVVYDDVALPWESLRLKQSGSAGGHNGMQSIIDALGTNAFARLRVGIHPGRPISGRAKYVLRPFGRAERAEVGSVVERAADVVRDLFEDGAQKAMARWNRKVPESLV